MIIKSSKSSLAGHVTVPGSKSHTIRALILSCLSEGTSHIKNPLKSNDCLSTVGAVNLIGGNVDAATLESDEWTVTGTGKNLHLPECGTIDVGNSGSLMYFLAPVLATLPGTVTFTGDESICSRPVGHLLDAINKLGGKAESVNNNDKPPFRITGPINPANTLYTEGKLSQYISGIMMATSLMDGTLNFELSDPQETPYLTMTQLWLEKMGMEVSISDDYKKISVKGPVAFKAFDTTIPSDWEGVAFPLIAALISGSEIVIDNVDTGKSQGDRIIVDVLKQAGADLEMNEKDATLTVRGGNKLSTANLPGGKLTVDISSFPDAICAMAVIGCFIDGVTELTNVEICRKKETDRVVAMTSELTKLGAKVCDLGDRMVIYGNQCQLHGGKVESYKDHRIAMSIACLGLGLPEGQEVEIADGECCSVSFPRFVETMNSIGAGFRAE